MCLYLTGVMEKFKNKVINGCMKNYCGHGVEGLSSHMAAV